MIRKLGKQFEEEIDFKKLTTGEKQIRRNTIVILLVIHLLLLLLMSYYLIKEDSSIFKQSLFQNLFGYGILSLLLILQIFIFYSDFPGSFVEEKLQQYLLKKLNHDNQGSREISRCTIIAMSELVLNKSDTLRDYENSTIVDYYHLLPQTIKNQPGLIRLSLDFMRFQRIFAIPSLVIVLELVIAAGFGPVLVLRIVAMLLLLYITLGVVFIDPWIKSYIVRWWKEYLENHHHRNDQLDVKEQVIDYLQGEIQRERDYYDSRPSE